MVGLTDVLGRLLFEQAVSGAGKAKGKGIGKGKAGQAASYPTLSSEDALALKRSVREGKRKRSLEKRARL